MEEKSEKKIEARVVVRDDMARDVGDGRGSDGGGGDECGACYNVICEDVVRSGNDTLRHSNNEYIRMTMHMTDLLLSEYDVK